uniref:Palmdelphin n=1 Tax=Knipowitschia caucasica TaxID=637954 RepID=A0AAV2JJW0_KNICA
MSVCAFVRIQDKKRIREDISRKRRDIEEEKVKLQYIKKSLREQWLMDGLQSEEEREAMKMQVQDEVQRTAHLQSNIDRMEEEMFALEQQELQLSANEEAILKRLRQVERTTEDIIKELSAQPLSDLFWPSVCPRQGGDSMSNIFVEPSINSRAAQGHCPLESKGATFAMEISVELDKQTGKTQVISTASVTPETIHEKGLKVYEDSLKSVFALPPGEATKVETEMTPTEVDELLRQATHWSGDVLYHQPVHAAPFTGNGLDTGESHFGHNTPSLDRANRVLEELSPGAVTLVFMGYENVDEDEDNPIQAELVMMGNSEEENSSGKEVFSVYHPTGCTSKTLQPQVGIAGVKDGRYFNEEHEGGESLLHKPTFKHRSIKNASKSEGWDGARL